MLLENADLIPSLIPYKIEKFVKHTATYQTFPHPQILGLSTGNLHGNLTGPLKALSTCDVTVAASPWNTPILASALMAILSRTWLPLPIAAMALPWL